MGVEAGWLADPMGAHQHRYWDGSAWTEHVADAGTAGVEPLPADVVVPPPPEPAPATPPPPPTAAGTGTANTAAADSGAAAAAPPTGKVSWKDRLKQASDKSKVLAAQAAQQGKQMADQAKTAVSEQQAKRTAAWEADPETLWHGGSKGAATTATGMSKAYYRVTKDRVWIESGLFGVSSQNVPLWSVKDIDVRQSMVQRGKDVGDVVLVLEDPSYGVATGGTFDVHGASGDLGTTSGTVVLDNIEGPYNLRDLMIPLVSDARRKKLVERQTQYVHMNPGVAAATMAQPAPAPQAPAPAADAGQDLADRIRKLAALRDEGLLTEDEFAAQKAKLLAG